MLTKTGSDLLEKTAFMPAIKAGFGAVRQGITRAGNSVRQFGSRMFGNTPKPKPAWTPKSTPARRPITRNRVGDPSALANTAIKNSEAPKQPGFLWRNKGRIATGGLTIGAGAMALNANKDAISNPQQGPVAQNLQQPNSYPHPSQQYF